jgi:prolipoprotein diacylglyceryl transferase
MGRPWQRAALADPAPGPESRSSGNALPLRGSHRMPTWQSLNAGFDGFARLQVSLRGYRIAAFRACSLTGLAAGLIYAFGIGADTGLSESVLVTLAVTSVLALTGLALTAARLGLRRLISYHYQFAFTAVCVPSLVVLRQPVLPYLDVAVLGFAVFLACGRIGCLMVGCCHGRPYRLGIRYGLEHALAGFPCRFVGVRLLPVQAIEALLLAATVLLGTVLVIEGAPAGTAIAWYGIAYSCGRFCLEFMRGDEDRRYRLGLSEAQWSSALLLLTLLALESAGVLPYQTWHVAAAASVAATVACTALDRCLHGV